MTRRAHLSRIAAAAKAVWPPCSHRLLLLTGQGSLRSSPLSPSQADFLSSLAPLPIEPVLTGFPFDEAPIPNRPTSLVEACVQNARQYLWARNEPAYGRAVASALQPILASVSRCVILVTGSCGLQMLEVAWPHLRLAPKLRVEILALGPVGAPPHFGEAGFSAVQGTTDLWSRMLYRGSVAYKTNCGHMDYWSDAVARNALRTLAERLLTGAT